MRITSCLLSLVVLSFINLETSRAWSQEADTPPKLQESESNPGSKQVEIPEVTEERPMNFWMAKKLDYSKSILEALTMGDFSRLAVDAERLRVLGKLEGFVRNRNADYRVQMSTFDLATLELVSSAKCK